MVTRWSRSRCGPLTCRPVRQVSRAKRCLHHGEIDNAARNHDRAGQHYTTAIELGRRSAVTFLVGVASVGRVTALAAADRAADAPAPGLGPGTGAAPVGSRGGQGPGRRRGPWRHRAQVRLSDPGQGQWVRSRKASGAGLSRMSASSSLT